MKRFLVSGLLLTFSIFLTFGMSIDPALGIQRTLSSGSVSQPTTTPSVQIFDFKVTWADLVAGGGSYGASLERVRQYSGTPVFELVGNKADFRLVRSSKRLGSGGIVDCAPAPDCYAIEIEAEFRIRNPQRFAPAMTPTWCANFNYTPGLISGVSCSEDIRMAPLGDGRTWKVRGESWPRETSTISQTAAISIVAGEPICPRPVMQAQSNSILLSADGRNQLVSRALQNAQELLAQRAALGPLSKAEKAIVFVRGVLTGLAELPHLVRDASVVIYGLTSTGEYPPLQPASMLGQAWKRELEAGTPAWQVALKAQAMGAAMVVVPYAPEAFLVAGVATSALEGNDESLGTNLAFGLQLAITRSAPQATSGGTLRPSAPTPACGCPNPGRPNLLPVKITAPGSGYDFKLMSNREAFSLANIVRRNFESGHGAALIPVVGGKGRAVVLVASKKKWADAMGVTRRVRNATLCSGRKPNPKSAWDTEILGLEYTLRAFPTAKEILVFGLKNPCPNCRSYLRRIAREDRVKITYWSAQTGRRFTFPPP